MSKEQKFADISVEQDGVVRSLQFEDIYFDMNHGLDESIYVFLKRNNLQERLTEGEEFTIIETGFGTGLNFLALLDLIKEKSLKRKVRFFSVEKFPVDCDVLRQALSSWKELGFTEELIDFYPSETGWHKKRFCSDMVELNLYIGDVDSFLKELSAEADCWFLDGFAPDRNPDMWGANLFEKMGEITKAGGTFTSFTSAGLVKRGLRSNGFFVKRFPGFGRKRHMIAGIFENRDCEAFPVS